ncbi:hypothetical protein V5799_029730 [Amblyomma americanum]|uniref:Ran gtpase-activating protein n=1 Tax=Amblyomma americanum TaxID=6943 RepID=A0AAQ4EQ91_AMBAM
MGNGVSRHGSKNARYCLASNGAILYVRSGPCTSESGRRCAIFRKLEVLNNFLRPIGLELIEVLPGRLSLAWYQAPWVVTAIQNASRYHPRIQEECQNLAGNVDNERYDEEDRLRALSVVQDILKNHRCVVSVDVVGEAFAGEEELIADALTRAAPVLRSLRIRSAYRVSQALVDYLGNAIGSLNHLQELAWTHDKLQRCPSDSVLAFLRMTTTLSALELTEVHMPAPHAATLFRALKKNRSLKTLCLSACLVISDPNMTGEILRDYVSSARCGLLSLTVRKSCTSHPPSLKAIADGVCMNKNLQHLDVAGFFLGRWNFGIISKLLTVNQTLLKLTLIGTSWTEAFQARFSSRKGWKNCDCEGPHDMALCLKGIAHHKSLEQLTVDISTFTANEFTLFCEAVRANEIIRMVTLVRVHDDDVNTFCGIIRKTGTENRIRLEHNYVVKNRLDDLAEYPNLIKTVVWNVGNLVDMRFFEKSQHLFPRCAHVTSLSLSVSHACLLSADVMSTVAEFLETTAHLRTLQLKLSVSGAREASQGILVQALSKNSSLRTLRLHGMRLTAREMGQLAVFITGNRMLCDFGFFVSESNRADMEMFIIELELSRFSDNYTMLQLSHSNVCDEASLYIHQLIRRNRALAMRALHCAMGVTQNKSSAGALEDVSTEQGVIREVAVSAGVDEATAAAVLKQALDCVVEADGYVKATGVLQNSAICRSASEDSDWPVQLDGLDVNSWRHVLQFLKFAEVAGE